MPLLMFKELLLMFMTETKKKVSVAKSSDCNSRGSGHSLHGIVGRLDSGQPFTRIHFRSPHLEHLERPIAMTAIRDKEGSSSERELINRNYLLLLLLIKGPLGINTLQLYIF